MSNKCAWIDGLCGSDVAEKCPWRTNCRHGTTPERAADPTREALALATETVTGWYDSGYYQELSRDVALALDAFAREAVEKERERCAAIANEARSEAGLERHKTEDPEAKACWLWAFDTANWIERSIHNGDRP